MDTTITQIHDRRQRREQDWERWFAEAGLEYVEVERCPDPGCDVCTAPEREAA